MTESGEPRMYPGSLARMITAMVERVALAGESAEFVANDYGPWEWGSPPDLSAISAAREGVAQQRHRAEAAEAECVAMREVVVGLPDKIRANADSLWPAGVSFVSDAKRHGAQQAAMWVAMETGDRLQARREREEQP